MFWLAKEVWNEGNAELTEKDRYQNSIFFLIGEPNPYGEYFVGQSYLAPVSKEQIPVFNVTTVINIPAEVKHWHGAAVDSWFSHLALEIPGEECPVVEGV